MSDTISTELTENAWSELNPHTSYILSTHSARRDLNIRRFTQFPLTARRLDVLEIRSRPRGMHVEGYSTTYYLSGRARVKYLRERLRALRAAATRFKEEKPTSEAEHWDFLMKYEEYLEVATELLRLRPTRGALANLFTMDVLLFREVQQLLAASLPAVPPADCDCGRPGIFMCSSCGDGARRCQGCVVAAHAMRPCHLVKKWTRGAFRARPLIELGLWVNLGHAGGECAASIAACAHAMTPDRLFRTNFNKKRKKPATTAESALKGSSANKPWQLGNDGQLFLAGSENLPPIVARSPPRRRISLFQPSPPRAGPSRSVFAGPVFGGPPSPPRPSPSTFGRAPRTTSIREAREDVQGRRIIFGGPPSIIGRRSPPAAPVRRPLPPRMLPRRHGYGLPPTWKLTTEDLYMGTARPPVLVRRMLDKPVPAGADPEEVVDPKPHHKCAICCSPKSHPVS
ncbi:hypothetical protein B0H16DRAFT_1748000 [Mycena metata]|uniref:Uncharacterized protein n=1 Tax=Mycena metata TaxID=1033252 RepID=A0AAD7GR12_9AGAR|nr:hypothetical protein B0H16DRAFT_1748000 [Mycena metata]